MRFVNRSLTTRRANQGQPRRSGPPRFPCDKCDCRSTPDIDAIPWPLLHGVRARAVRAAQRVAGRSGQVEQELARLFRRPSDHPRPGRRCAEPVGNQRATREPGRARHSRHGPRGCPSGSTRPVAAAAAQRRSTHGGLRSFSAGILREHARGCDGRAVPAPGTDLAADRKPDPLGPIHHLPLRRRHRARCGVLGRGSRRRRIDPRLRRAARKGHGGLHGQCDVHGFFAARTKPS